MPIYEFYCSECHTVFNFFSPTVDTEKTPRCPRCETVTLSRQVSRFSTPRSGGEDADMPELDMDDARMERAMNLLAREAEHMDEDDPRQAASLMRTLADMTGLELGPGMEEMVSRMERGEDPERIEAEMGDLLEQEEPFGVKAKPSGVTRSRPPRVDDTLYEL